MGTPELIRQEDPLRGCARDQIIPHLSSLIDRIYEARAAFAYASVLLTESLKLRSLPGSRRAYIEKQRDLFAGIARGEWVKVWTDRDQTAFNGISRYAAPATDIFPEIGKSVDQTPAPDELISGAVSASRELYALSALAGYESGVVEAHLFTKVPVTFERSAKEIIDVLEKVQAQKERFILDVSVNRKTYLSKVGAKTTLTNGGYLDAHR